MCGFPPFFAENNKDLFAMIKKADYDFPKPYLDGISDMAKDLISKLLVVDPKKRLTAEEMLKHPWIMGEKTPRKGLPEVSSKIREYNLKEKGAGKYKEEHK